MLTSHCVESPQMIIMIMIMIMIIKLSQLETLFVYILSYASSVIEELNSCLRYVHVFFFLPWLECAMLSIIFVSKTKYLNYLLNCFS